MENSYFNCKVNKVDFKMDLGQYYKGYMDYSSKSLNFYHN